MTKVCIALLAAGCLFAQTRAGHAPPQFYRIDDRIYRGDQPRDSDFAGFAEMGIKTVLDLRGGIFHAPRERKLAEAAGLQYVSIQLSGLFAPTDQQVAKILAVLEDPNRSPLFVHCKRGGDRVGLVIACYRMAHDHWSNSKALEEARNLGLSRWEPLMRRYIRRFDAARLPRDTSPALSPQKLPN